MKTKELIKQIRGHRGKVEVPVLVAHDVIHVFAEKGDLIEQLSKVEEIGLKVQYVNAGVMRLETES